MDEETRPYRLCHAAAFKLRGLLMAPLLSWLLVWGRWEWEQEIGIWTLGLSLFLPGLALRVWSQIHLRYRLRGGRDLATEGPYAWTRNPVYIGNLLMAVGFCVMCELPWAMPIVLAWGALVYDTAVRFEEGRLTKRYGEAYVAYCRRVPRWRPRRPLKTGVHAPGVGTWRAFAVEWQCLFLPVAAMIKEWWH